jgi:hypothetical protein
VPSQELRRAPASQLLAALLLAGLARSIAETKRAMIPISVPIEGLAYQMAVIALYLDLPDTPLRANGSGQQQARGWFQRGIPLPVEGSHAV